MSQKRYLGLELAGAKSAKTTLAVLEYYPKEQKVFLLDIHTGITADANANSDEALIQTLIDHADGHPDLKMGVNVPLSFPPCITCTRKTCPLPANCSVPEVKWMRASSARAYLTKPKKRTTSQKNARIKELFTPYTQRPVEIWLKHEVLAKMPERLRFELDETLGGNKAPLTARMHFLKFHLQKFQMVEVLPKLTVALLTHKLKLSQKVIADYRNLEEGMNARGTIIERMADHLDIFIYDRDLKKLTQNLSAFDAFLCAYTVLLSDRNQCVNPPKGFPQHSGFVSYPKSPLLDPNSPYHSLAEGSEE